MISPHMQRAPRSCSSRYMLTWLLIFAELLKPSLRALLVTRTEGVTDRGLVEVVMASRSLTHLDLSSVPCITDVGLREAAMALGSTLRVLRVSQPVRG